MARSDTFEFVHVTRIVAGPGTSDQAGEELRALGATRAMVVTDRGIAASGILGKLEPGLKRARIAYDIFDEIEPNPGAAAVERAAEQARTAGADAVLAVGGGSPIDAGKMVAVLARFGWHGARLRGDQHRYGTDTAAGRNPNHRRHWLRGDSRRGHHRHLTQCKDGRASRPTSSRGWRSSTLICSRISRRTSPRRPGWTR